MAGHTDALHHFHTRKRIYQKLEKYPHPHKLKRFMDGAIYAIGIIGPLMTIPQVTKIWIEKNAAGISVISWSAYVISAGFWLVYGILHKEKPIILTYTFWLVLQLLVVIGAVIY